MSLNENPIFLTQKRLVHRGGVLAAILIAALLGLCLLFGLIANMASPFKSPGPEDLQDAGRMFYGWTIGIEIVALIIGSFSRITRALTEERKSGLWDSNRLTPLKPSQLIVGYWFGSPLREFYMGAILAGIGLPIVLLARLPIMLWLGTQLLIVSTALLLGLLAVLLGLVLQKPQAGLIFLVLLFFLQFFSFALPKYFLTNFLLPIYGVAHLFEGTINHRPYDYGWTQWTRYSEIFGQPVYPVFFTLGLQLLLGIFLWRIVIRKTANSFQPAMLRWEAVALFAVFLIFQHGLIWGEWRGHFPELTIGSSRLDDQSDVLLPVVQAGTMFLAILMLALNSPPPESVRIKAVHLGLKTPGAIFPSSSVFLAFVLSAAAAAIMLSEFIYSDARSWRLYFIAMGNLLAFSLIFSLLMEFCRLRYKRRAIGFVALWLFVLGLLPFIFAGVLDNSAYGQLSIVAPGCYALSAPADDNLNYLFGIIAGHLLIAFLLFLFWGREWQKLLARAV